MRERRRRPGFLFAYVFIEAIQSASIKATVSAHSGFLKADTASGSKADALSAQTEQILQQRDDLDQLEKQVTEEVRALEKPPAAPAPTTAPIKLVDQGHPHRHHHRRDDDYSEEDYEPEYSVNAPRGLEIRGGTIHGGTVHIPIPQVAPQDFQIPDEQENQENLQNEIARLVSRVQEHKDFAAEKQQEMMKALKNQSNQVQDMQSRILQLQAILEKQKDVENQNAQLGKQNQIMREELEKNLKVIRAMKTKGDLAEKHFETEKAAIQSGSQKVEEKIQETAAAQARNAEQAIATKTEQVQQLKNQVEEMTSQQKDDMQQMQHLNNELAEKTKLADTAQQTVIAEQKASQEELESTKKALAHENSDLLKKNQNLTLEGATYKQTVQTVQHQLHETSTSLQSLQTENEADSQEAQKAVEERQQEIKVMGQNLAEQHNYGKLCHSKVSQLEMKILATVQDSNDKKTLAADNATLQKLNAVLRSHMSETTSHSEQLQQRIQQDGLDLQAHIASAKDAAAKAATIISQKDTEITNLRTQLVAHHNYGTQCTHRVNELMLRLHADQTADQDYERKVTEAAHLAHIANEQIQNHLTDSAVHFKNIAEAQHDMAQDALNKLTGAKTEISDAQAKLEFEKKRSGKQFQHMKFEEGALRSQLKTCDEALMQNVEARNNADKEKRACQTELLNTGVEQLQMKLDQCIDSERLTQRSLNEGQLKLAKCNADRDSAANAAKAMEEQLKLVKEQVRTVQEDANKQIVAKAKEVTEYQEEAQKALMEAKAQLSNKCSVIWKKRNAKTAKKLKECKLQEEDLRMAQAQTVTLEQSLKACMQTQK